MTVTPVARDDDSARFFDAAARGELLVLRCADCDSYSAPSANTCVQCGSLDLAGTAARGSGRLVSWTIVPPRSPDSPQVPPTVVGLIELAEGPWLVGNVSGADPTELEVGLPVRVAFERPSAESEVVPYFLPQNASHVPG